MIVDVHSHAWRSPHDFSDDFRRQARRVGASDDLTVRLEDYRQSIPPDEDVVTVVFGGKARLSGLWVDDAYVAQYVQQDPRHLIGFLSLDPTQEGCEGQMRDGHELLGLQGIKLMPMYAGFDPRDERVTPVWEYASRHGLPVLLHTGTTFISQAPLKYTLPRLLDDVAIRFPECKMVLAHLGHPYENECVATIRKHENLYADISALHYRPHQFYQSLLLAQQYNVWDKLLFGTDYPFTTVEATIRGLQTLNDMLQGTSLPRLNTAEIESLIQRDTLGALGLTRG